ncbi:MAG: ATP-binding protein [Leptonema sp. (in: bacteria)]
MTTENESSTFYKNILIQGFGYSTKKDTNQKIRMQILSDPKFLKAFRNFIYEISLAYGIKPNIAFDIKIICSEIVSNIIKHAYQNYKQGWIFFEYLFYTTYVELRFRDFSSRSLTKNVFIEKDLSEFRESGLGLYVISKLSDYYYFDSNEELGNLFVVKKRI